jgi:hypothetical protein
MSYQRLLIFCEGPDDERFFDTVVRPRLTGTYDWISTVQYANRKSEEIGRYIRTAQQRSIDLLFVQDVDEASCITACIETIRSTFGEHLSSDSIYIVVKEIESWYAAGMSRQRTEEMLGRPLQRTDDLTKERFNDLLPDDTARIDFMQRLLDHFDPEHARAKNHSFEYFCSAVLD